MHELGIAQDFWGVIKETAQKSNLKKITKITFVVGEASGIEIDFLEHSMKDHILPQTIANDAKLEFVKVKLVAKCNDCKFEITKDNIINLCCPQCASSNIDVVSGKETYVQSIEGE